MEREQQTHRCVSRIFLSQLAARGELCVRARARRFRRSFPSDEKSDDVFFFVFFFYFGVRCEAQHTLGICLPPLSREERKRGDRKKRGKREDTGNLDLKTETAAVLKREWNRRCFTDKSVGAPVCLFLCTCALCVATLSPVQRYYPSLSSSSSPVIAESCRRE